MRTRAEVEFDEVSLISVHEGMVAVSFLLHVDLNILVDSVQVVKEVP
jgi:hypothetical protein